MFVMKDPTRVLTRNRLDLDHRRSVKNSLQTRPATDLVMTNTTGKKSKSGNVLRIQTLHRGPKEMKRSKYTSTVYLRRKAKEK